MINPIIHFIWEVLKRKESVSAQQTQFSYGIFVPHIQLEVLDLSVPQRKKNE